MYVDTQDKVVHALRRIVRQAFFPPPRRHQRQSRGSDKCHVTCQACAIEEARKALEAVERDDWGRAGD